MKRLLATTVVAALTACGAPLTIDDFHPDQGRQQAYDACRAEVMRDLHNSNSPMTVAVWSKTRMTECMEGHGYRRS